MAIHLSSMLGPGKVHFEPALDPIEFKPPRQEPLLDDSSHTPRARAFPTLYSQEFKKWALYHKTAPLALRPGQPKEYERFRSRPINFKTLANGLRFLLEESAIPRNCGRAFHLTQMAFFEGEKEKNQYKDKRAYKISKLMNMLVRHFCLIFEQRVALDKVSSREKIFNHPLFFSIYTERDFANHHLFKWRSNFVSKIILRSK